MTKENVISLKSAPEIEEEAADWVMRLADGDASRQDNEAFQRWIAQSSSHRDVFDKLADFYGATEVLGRLDDFAESHAGKTALSQHEASNWRRRVPLRQGGAIAASLAIAAVGVSLFFPLRGSYTDDFETLVGEQETIDLPDGSNVVLNTDSRLSVAFTGDARTLRLEAGEAYFDVAHDADRPFTVHTEQGDVVAVGTAFSVRVRESGLDVLVTEGRVALSARGLSALGEGAAGPGEGDREPAAPPVMEITAGQAATFGEGIETISVVRGAALEKAIDWKDGELNFRGETLQEVIDDVSRYTDLRIEIGDADLGQQKIVGRYRVGDVERMFEALNVMANIEVEQVGENHVRLHRSE